MGSSVSVGLQVPPSSPFSGGRSQPQSRRASQFSLSFASAATQKLKKSKSSNPNASKRNSIIATPSQQTPLVIQEFQDQSSNSSSCMDDSVHHSPSRTLKSPSSHQRMKTFPSALLRNNHAKSSPRVLVHSSTSNGDDMQMTDAEDEDDGSAIIYRNQHQPEEVQDMMPPLHTSSSPRILIHAKSMGVLNQSQNSLKSLSESLASSSLMHGFYSSSIIPESNLLKETNMELQRFAPSLSLEENQQLGYAGDGNDFVIQMLQCSPMASAITDLKGNILAMNSAFKQIFKVKEVLNPIKDKSEVGHVTNFIPPEYRNQHDKHMLKFKNNKETKMKRITFGYTTEGEKIPIMLTVALTTLPSTQKPCYICFVKDLTFEFKHSTLAEMYDTVTGFSSFPIVAIDEDCIIKLFNRAAETTWMVTKLEVMERNVNILMPESIGRFHTKMVQSYCMGKKQGKLINRVQQVVGKRVGNGREFPLEIKIAEIRHEINLKRSFIAFLRDLTAVMTAREFQLTLYPVSVVNQLEAGERTIHKYHSCISVLFCDIVGFTEISRRMSSEELVKLLDEIITSFDENLLVRFGLEKIKTMGDNYMCASGLDSNPNHASNIVEAAFEMQNLIIEFNKKHAMDLRDRFPSQYHVDENTISVRVGINSGELVAGIVGSKKPVYDVFGDTVNMASRMESSGIESEVQITQATYNLLRDDLKKRFVLRRNVNVKGVGLMDTYISQLRQEREKNLHPSSPVESSTYLSKHTNGNSSSVNNRNIEFEELDDSDLDSFDNR